MTSIIDVINHLITTINLLLTSFCINVFFHLSFLNENTLWLLGLKKGEKKCPNRLKLGVPIYQAIELHFKTTLFSKYFKCCHKFIRILYGMEKGMREIIT